MKTPHWYAGLTALLMVTHPVIVPAQETATVKEDRVNVRGQASLLGEIITQLKQGETVVVLEEITVAKPKPGEPVKWLRIQMPANTPVWVNALYIDSDKMVKPSRLNARAGPGENYSVVGRLEKGTPVKDIQTRGDWMEIETPANAFAFIAADLVGPAEAAAAAAVPAPDKPAAAPAPVSREPKPVAAPPPGSSSPTAQPPMPRPAAAATPPPLPGAQRPPAAATTTPAAGPSAKPVGPAPRAETAGPAPKRIVTREGIVRSTVSIQAPSSFALENAETGKVMNYLRTDKLGVKLTSFRGRSILVTGEETVDPRWPKVPVIDVETLRLAP